jgi:hypothetical protein
MRYAKEPDAISVAKGNNTYQIVYTGNSDIAMDGAEFRYGKSLFRSPNL